jgi:serine protease
MGRRHAGTAALLAALLSACGGGGGGGGGSTPATPPPAANAPPVAEAGLTQSVASGSDVILDGGASSDPDGSIASWAWAQTDGEEVTLEAADQPQARFRAPVADADTTLTFRLTVTDDDGATASDSVSITVEAAEIVPEYRVSGTVVAPAGQDLDGDTNDPFNDLRSNDDPRDPQPLGNPTTLGGYVNEAGAGAEGRSQVNGDPEDYFVVDLLEGQRINLLVADFRESDADLYLYTPAGELLDFSIETGELEELTVAAAGRYVINVSIFAGATNYTLAIGAPLTPAARTTAIDVVPWELVVDLEEEETAAPAVTEDLALRWDAQVVGGSARRERLLALQSGARDAQVLRRRLGRQLFRRDHFADRGIAAQWETRIAAKRMARRPGVRSAEPNYRLRPLATVDDEAFAFQWHYPLINVPGAWDSSTGSPEVVVAVVDTGILAAHPDLAGQLVDGYDFVRDATEAGDGDSIDPDPEETIGGGDPSAVNYHGSHVSGTVAARGNNGIGVVGVAYDARVMPLRALTASGGTAYDVRQAVRYAAGLDNDSGTLPSRPADIINLSLGGGGFSQLSQNLYNELRALGIIVVAAAGNEGSTVPSYPASYDNVISVSAVDARQRITSYSNTGSRIDVAAPGGDGSRDINGDGYPDGVLSTGRADGVFAYTFLSGTSMAAPHVAGVFALMKAVNPDLDADDIDRLLQQGLLTEDLGDAGRDDRYGHGLIDARRAIDAALAEAGNGSTVPPRLATSTSALNFGTGFDTLDIVLSNAGSGDLTVDAITPTQPWLSVDGSAARDDGLGRYTVGVDRDSLAPGIYEGALLIDSSAGSTQVRALAAVADSSIAELGTLYLLVYDPDNDSVVAQGTLSNTIEGYRFSLPNVPAGNYQFFAGTDFDNDLLICDPGEACGAFLTIEDPLTTAVDGDRDDIAFPVEYLIAIPGVAARDEATRMPPTLSREVPHR